MIPSLIPLEIDTGFLAVFISGGGAAMLWALVQAYRTLRAGAQADELDEYTRMEHNATAESRRRSFAETERDYWHKRSAAMEYELTRTQGPEATQQVIGSVGEPPQPPVNGAPSARYRRRRPTRANQARFEELPPEPPAPSVKGGEEE